MSVRNTKRELMVILKSHYQRVLAEALSCVLAEVTSIDELVSGGAGIEHFI